ncbi:MAG: hypothetical protein U0031_07110 [Thermomicrobiales bacterium]
MGRRRASILHRNGPCLAARCATGHHAVGCALEPAFRWRGCCQSAQSFFYSDTGLSEPAEIDPAAVPVLPLDQVNFQELHRAWRVPVTTTMPN